MTQMIGPDAPLPQLANLYLNIQLKNHSLPEMQRLSGTTDSYLWRHTILLHFYTRRRLPPRSRSSEKQAVQKLY